MRTTALLILLYSVACTNGALGVGEDSGWVPVAAPPPAQPAPVPDAPTLPDVGPRCGGAARTQASACGPGDRCVVQRDEVLAVPTGWNDGPQIVIDRDAPLVFVPEGELGAGQLLRRIGDTHWSTEATARGVTGALARAAGGIGRFDYDGAFGLTYSFELGSDWLQGVVVPGRQIAFGASLAVDDRGCAYGALTSGDDGRVRLARLGDDWAFAASFGNRSVARADLALGDDGAPQLVGWDSASGLVWARPPGAAVVIAPDTQPPVTTADLRFDVAGPTPHVLFVDGRYDLLYASAADGWAKHVLGVSHQLDSTCGGPANLGATCVLHTTEVLPIAVLTDAASLVRLVWSETANTTNGVAHCPGGPPLPPGQGGPDEPALSPDLGMPGPPSCSWALSVTSESTTIHVATPDDLDGSTMTVVHGLGSASAALADDGSIHVAGYDQSTVRYLMIAR